ncbi:MAG: hypothetical protein KDG54_05535 [Geminicoccaceae bacterium]|nr:hypothetical protein [Geminicoccaceae bacterium]
MRLNRIELRSVRKLQPGCIVEGLDPGINVIGGDNEEGKSSLLLALKCAFFLTHTTSGGLRGRLVPHGTNLTPEVHVDFETGGKSYRLAKAFKRNGVSLESDGGKLAGADAERRLEELLDFRRAKSAPSDLGGKHSGISGLFWIDQGSAFAGVEPSDDDQDRLSTLLAGEIDRAVSGDDGDRLVCEAGQLYERYWTATGRQSKESPVSQAEQIRNKLQENFTELDRKVQEFDSMIGRLQREKTERARVLEENREARAAERHRAALERLDTAKALQNDLALKIQTIRAQESKIAILEDRAAERRRQSGIIAELLEEATTLGLEHERLQRASGEADRDHAEADADHKARRRELTELRRCLQRANDLRQKEAGRLALAQKRKTVEAVSILQQRIASAMAIPDHIPVTEKDLDSLRKADQQALQARIALEVVATRLEFTVDGTHTVSDDAGHPVDTGRPVDVIEPRTFVLEGFGQLHVTPGGESLGERQRMWERLDGQRRQWLERLGVDSLAQAEEHARKRRQAEGEIERLKTERRALLGEESLESLEVSIERLSERLQLPPDGEDPQIDISDKSFSELEFRIGEAEERLERLEEKLSGAEQQRQEARQQLMLCASRIKDNETRRLDSTRRLDELETLQPAAELDDELERMKEGRAILALEQARFENLLRDQDLSLIGEEAARFAREIEALASERRERDRRIDVLTTEIRTKGGEDIVEKRDAVAAELEAAKTRLKREELEAAAAGLLHRILSEERRRSRDVLTGPIRSRIEHYLPHVFPGARAVVDADNFRLTDLSRNDADEPFAELSIGTREQVSLMVRLALAELLVEHRGEAPPLILDDALVYADEERFERMKTLLSRAGQKLQVIILTCRPRDYLGLGKTYRLEDCRLSALP